MRRLVTTLAFAIAATGAPVLAAPLAAQKSEKPIPRPKLRDVTDTNDAKAYFEAGLRTFRNDPNEAGELLLLGCSAESRLGGPAVRAAAPPCCRRGERC
jgi:hypothetical protein